MSDKRNWINEFGLEYACPPCPAGFTDTSWHNDSCPSYGASRLDGSYLVRIFIEHPDQEVREDSEQAERFLVARFNREGEQTDFLFYDDWDRAVESAQHWAVKDMDEGERLALEANRELLAALKEVLDGGITDPEVVARAHAAITKAEAL